MREYLKQLRCKAGLTSAEAATRLNITAPAYTMIERGVRQADMTLSTMERLASAYNMTPEEIMHLEQDYRAQRDTA